MTTSLRLIRYKQDHGRCATAACATLANYYNPGVNYELAKYVCDREVSRNGDDGLYAGEIGILLNKLGFRKVKIVTCNLDIVDHSWKNLTSYGQVRAIDNMLRSRAIDFDQRLNLKSMRRFLTAKGFQNFLEIDNSFPEYIRKYVEKGKPVLFSFNWNMLLKFPKQTDKGKADYVRGHTSHHAVCANRCTPEGVGIVDSHHEFYKGQWQRYASGQYFIKWEELLPAMGANDVILADDYCGELLNYELVDQGELV
jgi:hypothetical protein